MRLPIRYLPSRLTKRDKIRQIRNLRKSRKLYHQGKYIDRPLLRSYTSKPSTHLSNARRIYGVDKIVPSKNPAAKTGCSINALDKIVKKGEGAYYSSGSRPNQTAQSWGYARLASAITGGKASIIDFDIIDKGCNHRKRAYKLAVHSKKMTRTKHTKHVVTKTLKN